MTLPIEASQVMPLHTVQARPDGDGVNVGQILSALWRHRLVFFSVTFSIMAAGFIVLKLLTPTYDSTVILVLAARQDAVVNMDQSYMNTTPPDAVVRSEVDALSSRTLMNRVIDRAGLTADPEFNQYIRPIHPHSLVCLPHRLMPGFLQIRLGCKKPDSSTLTPEQVKYNIVSQVLKAFSVTPDAKTYTVKLDVSSVDARKAARLANIWADEYMKTQVDQKVSDADRAMSELKPRLQQLGHDVASADSAVEKYKEEHGIVTLTGPATTGPQDNSNTMALQEVQSLNLELSTARTARAKLEAAQQEVRRVGTDPGQALSAPAVAAAPLVENLREQEATIAAQLASLKGTYGPRHPLVVSAQQQLDEVHQRLGQEVGRALKQFDSQVREAQLNEGELQARIHQLASVRSGESKDLSKLDQLTSAQMAAKTVYNTFVQGAYQAASQNGVPTAKGRIVQYADMQDWPSFPNIPIFMAVITIAALMIATGAVYAREARDKSFRSAGEIEEATGLNVLGISLLAPQERSDPVLPVLLKRKRLPAPISDLMITEPSSAISESLRLTRAAIASSRADRLPKTVMVTSAVPGEGKTTFALMLGRQSAASGSRTIVIEAEMRRPKFGRDLRSLPPKGLTDYLQMQAGMDEIIGVDGISGMHFIAAGNSHHGSGEMLGSTRMAQLLQSLSTQYDLVIVDTPPAAIVADALRMSGMMDAVILVVKWASTPTQLVEDGIKKLRAAKAPLIGVVLSQVDARRYKSYGHGPLAYQYARSYYTEA
jgi:capsular exopolysaccharide synthesis family protein